MTANKEWLTVKEAAAHAKCGVDAIYLGVKRKKLRAVRLAGRRGFRFLAEWVDTWLLAEVTIPLLEVDARGGDHRQH